MRQRYTIKKQSVQGVAFVNGLGGACRNLSLSFRRTGG